ncbi:hypothetical protein ACWELJ_22340 [Nocardia sp. NPDC004582]
MKAWDTARIAMMSKILGFYGMQYWYVWRVAILGLGPIWQSANAEAKAALDLVRRPVADPVRFEKVLTRVRALAGTYEMNP